MGNIRSNSDYSYEHESEKDGNNDQGGLSDFREEMKWANMISLTLTKKKCILIEGLKESHL